VNELRDPYGWTVELGKDDEDRGQGCKGLTLSIYPTNPDSYSGKALNTRFLYPVPAAAFNRASWEEWLWARIEETEGHERAENFVFIVAGCCEHPESHHEQREGQDRCNECDTDAWHEYRAPEERRPFKPVHADGYDPGVIRTVVPEGLPNTPNAGRFVKIPCLCGHEHNAVFGEHFTISRTYGCMNYDCECKLAGVAAERLP
jgi:hypothetical protein